MTDQSRAENCQRLAKFYFDGGCFPNPGMMDVGLVFIGIHSEEIYTVIGPGTNNQAEFYACVAGLQIALDLKIETLEVFGDSNLVINAYARGWNITSAGLIPIYNEGKKLLNCFKRVAFSWVPRDKNPAGKLIEKRR